MDMSVKVNFEIPVLWLIEIGVNKDVQLSDTLRLQARNCLIDNGYGEELKQAHIDRFNELKNKIKDVVGEDGMEKLNDALDNVSTGMEFAFKLKDQKKQ